MKRHNINRTSSPSISTTAPMVTFVPNPELCLFPPGEEEMYKVSSRQPNLSRKVHGGPLIEVLSVNIQTATEWHSTTELGYG